MAFRNTPRFLKWGLTPLLIHQHYKNILINIKYLQFIILLIDEGFENEG